MQLAHGILGMQRWARGVEGVACSEHTAARHPADGVLHQSSLEPLNNVSYSNSNPSHIPQQQASR
jgi:hypothetical protein